MPRKPRVFVESAIYHVYNRFARGAEILGQGEEAERFLDLLRTARDRDGVAVLAWCLMANHVHLAVRTGPVPLSRTMGYVQARFGQGHNRRWRTSGPLWQSRYKAKLVDDQRYLLQLIAYIHLNPVTAGIVSDPAEFPYSGHRELLGRTGTPLIDVDGVLELFGATTRSARRSYIEFLKRDGSGPWLGALPGSLPWWQREPDRPLAPVRPPRRLVAAGRAVAIERATLAAPELVRRVCALLRVDTAWLTGGGQDGAQSRIRYVVAGLGIERWGVRAGALGEVMGRRPEVVSRWATRAGELRVADPEFRTMYEALDAALAKRDPAF
jgi:REP element-mobilizing transposase RayT